MKNAFDIIKAGTVQLIPEQELAEKLASGKKLVVKLGADPTAPDLHLGHAVVLSKMRELQDLGHHIIFLIGDFTARIGDPTGKSKTRKPLSDEEIAHNTKTYFEQVGKILDKDKITIRFNSEWLDPLTNKELIKLCAQVTVARIIEREDFANRIKEQQPIGFHELMYPLYQGYDSVALNADIEIGGTDQTFNLLMGRYLQEQYGQRPQSVIVMPLLEGLDGVAKMSKSLGNYIGLTEPADQAFGKLMSISDLMMWRYFALLLAKTADEVALMQSGVADGSLHPMELKKTMAHGIVAKFWSLEQADKAREQFAALFQKKDLSQADEIALPADVANPIWLVDLMKILGSVSSSSEAKRLIEAGAVALDGVAIKDFKATVHHTSGMVIKVGKHKFYRLK